MNHFRVAKWNSFELLDLISLINKSEVNKKLYLFAIDKRLLPKYFADWEIHIFFTFLCTQNLSSGNKNKDS